MFLHKYILKNVIFLFVKRFLKESRNTVYRVDNKLLTSKIYKAMTKSETNNKGGNKEPKENKGQGPKFIIDIEGNLIEWDGDTITTEQIIELGGWDPSQGAILINLKDNTETTLQPGQVIELKPGMGFSKKVKFKRG